MAHVVGSNNVGAMLKQIVNIYQVATLFDFLFIYGGSKSGTRGKV